MKHIAMIDGDKLVCNGATYSGTDQVGHLCRALGYGSLEIYRDNVLSITITNVVKRGRFSLSEQVGAGLRYLPFRVFPVHVRRPKNSKHTGGTPVA